MKLLVSSRRRSIADPDDKKGPSASAVLEAPTGLAPTSQGCRRSPSGGPGVTALLAAAGDGYGLLRRQLAPLAPGGMMAALKHLVEEQGGVVDAHDGDGNTAMHHAAARGETR